MPFQTFCSAKSSTCIAVRLLKFSVLHGNGESKYRPVATNFQCLKMFCHMVCHLLGRACPKPCSSVALVSAQKRRVALHSLLHPGVGIYYFHRRSNMAEMKSPNVHAKKNRNDTPRKRKTHIIKVRVTAEEKLRIAYACKELHLTQSELVRRVLYGVNVKHTVVVAQGGEDALAALAALSAQCSQGRQQPQPACTAFQLWRQRHRAAPGADSGGTVRTHELSAES